MYVKKNGIISVSSIIIVIENGNITNFSSASVAALNWVEFAQCVHVKKTSQYFCGHGRLFFYRSLSHSESYLFIGFFIFSTRRPPNLNK